jgi:hypothetical protein
MIVEPLEKKGFLGSLSSPISIASYPPNLEFITSMAVELELSFEIFALVPDKTLQ